MPINWGIISTGKIAGKFAEDFIRVKNGKLLAVGSRSETSAKAFADRFQIERTYRSYEDLAADPDVQAVYIGTPHHLHYDNALMCLRNGKHVLCEKPLAVNAGQVKEMFAVAKDQNCLLMEAMWTFFLPVIQETRQWIHHNEIGKVTFLQANFGFKPPFNPLGRLFNPELAGGALLDIGIYPLSLAWWIFGEWPSKITTRGYLGTTGVDEQCVLLLEYEDQRSALLTFSLRCDLSNEALIYGETGHIHIPNFWKAKSATLVTQGQIHSFEDTRTTWGYHFEADEMNQLIETGKKVSSIVTPQFSQELIKVMDGIRAELGVRYPFE